MATQVQFRRGTTTQNNAFTGAAGEITVDTDVKTIRLHDGTTAGGGATLLNNISNQTALNKTFSTGSVWQGNAVGLAYGGTGSSLTAVPGAIPYSSSTGLGLSAAGTSGQILVSGGTGSPTWVAASSISAGTATLATTATNIAGGSAGQLIIQADTGLSTFITAGASGTFLRSAGAGYAPTWATADVTIGSTVISLGSSTTGLAGVDVISSTGTSHWTIPAGTTAQRPSSPAVGMIRYNSSQSAFEGYASGAWASLGGVKSVDGYTYIIAETSPTASNGDLDFYAENSAGNAATQVGQWNRTNLKDYTGTIVGTQTTQNVFNATATTVNAFGAATSLTIGATTGTMTLRNATVAHSGAVTVGTTLGVTGATTLSSTLGVTGNTTVGGTLGVTGATTLSSTLGVTGNTTLTGALAANGGITVDSTNFVVNGTTGAVSTASTITATGAISSSAGISGTTGSFSSNTTVGGTLGVTGVTSITNSTASSASTNGALVVTGGVGVGGALNVGGAAAISGNLSVTGNLTISGTTTTISTSNLEISDPIIYMGTGNSGNTSDLGFVAHFNNGTYQHTGLVRDATDSKWKLFSGITVEPTTTIDFTTWNKDTLVLGALECDTVSATGDITSPNFYTYSDRTLKSNIKESRYGLAEVMKLTSVEYDMEGKHEVGLIAQDVEEHMPEFVTTDANGKKKLDYAKMVSVLVKTVQQQQEQIEELKAKLGN